MIRLHALLLLLGALICCVAAESAPTFCKCTCYTNSTIVRLGPSDASSPSSDTTSSLGAGSGDSSSSSSKSSSKSSSSLFNKQQQQAVAHKLRALNPFTTAPGPGAGHGLSKSKRAASTSCTQCNRAFCINYNLPICKDAAEKDVVAMCFQRDSQKDQIIVWAFLLGTTGLLGWAALKRVVEMREQKKLASGLGLGGGLGGLGSGGGGREGANVRGAYAPVGANGR